MRRTMAMWAVLLVLSTWPYDVIAWDAYLGTRGQLTYADLSLAHRMVLEGGIYSRRTPEDLAGIAIGSTIWS